MSPMSLSETTGTRAFGILSSRVGQVLTAVEKNQVPPSENDRKVLVDGRDLLDRFIQGSKLVEGYEFKKKGEVAPRADSLNGFSHALTTLRALEAIKDDARASASLLEIRQQLDRVLQLRSAQALDLKQVHGLAAFFVTLASQFYSDLAKRRLAGAVPHTADPNPRGASGFFGRRVSR